MAGDIGLNFVLLSKLKICDCLYRRESFYLDYSLSLSLKLAKPINIEFLVDFLCRSLDFLAGFGFVYFI